MRMTQKQLEVGNKVFAFRKVSESLMKAEVRGHCLRSRIWPENFLACPLMVPRAEHTTVMDHP